MRYINFWGLIAISAVILIGIPRAYAARIYFYPEKIDVYSGDVFVVEVRVDTEGESVNAIDIEGSVGGGVIESIDVSNSLVQIFINKDKTSDNTFRFSGGTPGGFVGNGIIGRLNIRATETGNTSIGIDESSKVLTELGKEVEALEVGEAETTVIPDTPNRIRVSSRTHPDQTRWYKNDTVNLGWKLEDGVEYSYLISRDPLAVPDDNPDHPEGSLEWQGDLEIRDFGDGIFYFTVKRVGENNLARFTIKIDTTSPEWIAIEESSGVQETSGKDFVTFAAKDDLSGIDHYSVRVDDGLFADVEPPYILPAEFGTITLRAYDAAGNFVEDKVISETQRGIFRIYAIILLVIIGVVVVGIRPIREKIFTQKG